MAGMGEISYDDDICDADLVQKTIYHLWLPTL